MSREAFLFFLFVLGICWALIAAIVTMGKNEEAFMTACKQDHKEYECTAMWRSGNANTQVIPMYFPIGR